VNILLVDQFSELGGAQQCLRDLAPAMLAKGWNVHAALPPGGPLAFDGVTTYPISLGRYTSGTKSPADYLRFSVETPIVAGQIARLVRKHRIDLVYVNGPRVLPAAALGAKKLVFHCHSRLSGVPLSLLRRALLPRTHVIASSRFVAAPLMRRSRNLRIVYTGVPDHAAPREPNTRFRVGVVGRIAPEKGQLDFVRAVAQLELDAEFVICGAPLFSASTYAAEVKQAARDLPIQFIDWQDDIGPLLRGLDLLVVPSSNVDATPRVIPEAYSAGVPVVAYASGGIPELVQHGRTGLLTDDLADSIRELHEQPDLRATLSDGARQAYESRFTLERYRQEVVDFLTEI
jgi:glycosyltransferase involved in cell wall biosynthesis